MTYKNIGLSTKTFYGVSFAPGAVKDVPGYVNAPGMVRVSNTNEPQKGNKKRGRKPTVNESKPIDLTSIHEDEKLISKEEAPNG